jgi:uncharacterized membrane protein
MFEMRGGIYLLLGLGLFVMSLCLRFVLHDKATSRAAFLAGYIVIILGIAESNIFHPYWWINIVLMASWFGTAVYFYFLARKERGE